MKSRLIALALALLCGMPTLAFAQSPVISVGGANIATVQVSVASTATKIVDTRYGRGAVIIENTTTTAVYLGGSSVTTTTGMLLPGVVGASTGTATVTAVEAF